MFSDTHRASSPWHTRERMWTSALVLRSFFSFLCASLVSMSTNNRVSVTIFCSVVSDHICRISGWELFFQSSSFTKDQFSVLISEWWNTKPSFIHGQGWEFFDTAAHWHPKPSSYVIRARRVQILNYPGLTEWIHLQIVSDLREDVEFQDLQFELRLDPERWCYFKQSRQFFSQRLFCPVVPHLEIENLPQIGERFVDGYYWNRLRVDEQQRFELCIHAVVFCRCIRATLVQPYIHTCPGTPCSKDVDECLWVSDTAWNNDGVISKLEPWAFVWIPVRTPDVPEFLQFLFSQDAHESVEAQVEQQWRTGIPLQHSLVHSQIRCPLLVHCDFDIRTGIDGVEQISENGRQMMILHDGTDQFVMHLPERISKVK